jgi:hypothetical protein
MIGRNIPKPSTGSFRLQSRGSSSKFTFPSIDNGIDVVWSGNIGACINGTCADTQQQCDSNGCGIIGGSPQTLAEFTLSKNSIDYYDVEVINGFNVAVEMAPQLHTTKAEEWSVYFNNSDPYRCGNAGGKKPMTSVGSCTWEMKPPSYEYRWVRTGGPPCNSESGQCPGGMVCGLSNNIGVPQRFQRTCGTPLGYWSGDQICGIDPNFGAPFNCNERAPAPNVGLTKRNL